MTTKQQVKSKRSCGSCTLCCTLQGVHDMPDGHKPKPPCVKCKLLRKGRQARKHGSCSVYETRPSTCKTYRCLWLDGLGDKSDRPDKLGVLFELHEKNLADLEDKTPYVVARTKTRGEADTSAARSLIQFLTDRIRVVVVNPDQVNGWITTIVQDEVMTPPSDDVPAGFLRPFKYDGVYIRDAAGQRAADFLGDDSAETEEADLRILRARGWGRISYFKDPQETMDTWGEWLSAKADGSNDPVEIVRRLNEVPGWSSPSPLEPLSLAETKGSYMSVSTRASLTLSAPSSPQPTESD